jgi:hypothetical protein
LETSLDGAICEELVLIHRRIPAGSRVVNAGIGEAEAEAEFKCGDGIM